MFCLLTYWCADLATPYYTDFEPRFHLTLRRCEARAWTKLGWLASWFNSTIHSCVTTSTLLKPEANILTNFSAISVLLLSASCSLRDLSDYLGISLKTLHTFKGPLKLIFLVHLISGSFTPASNSEHPCSSLKGTFEKKNEHLLVEFFSQQWSVSGETS